MRGKLNESDINERFMFTIRCLLFLIAGLLTVPLPAQKKPTVDFNRDIRPILSNKCFACHGPDKKTRESGLRLDTFEGATEDGAVVPGDSAESELINRITSDDEDEIMPPPNHGKPLTAKEKKLLADWIDSGAKYSKHWSYISPTRPEVPQPKNDVWSKNEIDRFVLKKMQARKLSPNSPADRYAIIRRLSFDLTGLPPSIQEADEFVNDKSENAYEKLVDRLLVKPAFGERWASVWLDLARYADSAGYAEDRRRTIWAYRDYVIRSFNANKPFDQFTIEQIAGDLLPNVTTEQLIATAFHRNTLTNSEGGTSDEEFRSAAVVDRVNTTLAVWMGTTMACAQCHTHKYDPITQKEYFQFYAFFNSTADNDQPNESPTLPVYTNEQTKRRGQLTAKIKQLNVELAKAKSSNARMSAAAIQEYFSKLGKPKPVNGQYVRVEIAKRVGILSLAEVQIFSGKENIALKGTAKQSSTAYNAQAKLAIDGNTAGDFTKKSVTHTNREKNPWWEIDLGSMQQIDRISLWNRTGPNMPRRLDNCRVSILDKDKKVVWQKDFAKAKPTERAIHVASPPANIVELSELPADKRNQKQNATLRNYIWQNSKTFRDLTQRLQKLNSELKTIKPTTTVPVMRERSKPRVTKIQIRGNFLDTGETVSQGTPKVFHTIPGQQKLDRLTLARWLIDRKNPLTARVVVNRFWEKLFGIGIVSTSEEFGNQGELPSHPELLDWLAVEFMESGWNQKALIKRIVMSATYRQSSVCSQQKIQADPANRFLARGPRFRLHAEMVRDQALFASGLLNSKMYGPPVQPPQPKFGLKAAFSGSVDWTDSTGPDRYRRAIYTEWRRSAPYPSMTTFDKSNREVCEVKRARTNTPLQALVTLNDPAFFEAAQALARRITKDSKKKPHEIAEHAFRLCLTRKPTKAELQRIVKLYRDSKKHFADHPEQAKLLATDKLNPNPAKTDHIDLAAWTTVANVLLNLDEIFLKR